MNRTKSACFCVVLTTVAAFTSVPVLANGPDCGKIYVGVDNDTFTDDRPRPADEGHKAIKDNKGWENAPPPKKNQGMKDMTKSVKDAVDEARKQATDRDKPVRNGTLIFQYAGHGGDKKKEAPDGSTYWDPVIGTPGDFGDFEEIAKELKRLPEGWSAVVIIDSCGGGEGGKTIEVTVGRRKGKITYISGATTRRPGEDKPSECPKVGTGGNKPVSFDVVNGLVPDDEDDPKSKPADKNKDGEVTTEELIEYIKSVQPPTGGATIKSVGNQASLLVPIPRGTHPEALAMRGTLEGLFDAELLLLDPAARSLNILDARTATLLGTIDLSGHTPTSVVWDGQGIWVLDQDAKLALLIDDDGVVLRSIPLDGINVDGSAIINGKLYVLDLALAHIRVYDLGTGLATDTIPLGGATPVALTADQSKLYLLDGFDNQVWQLDPETGDTIFFALLPDEAGPAFTAMRPWLSDHGAFAWLNRDGSFVSSFAIPEPGTLLLLVLATTLTIARRRRIASCSQFSRNI